MKTKISKMLSSLEWKVQIEMVPRVCEIITDPISKIHLIPKP